jgi:L-fuconolactonase
MLSDMTGIIIDPEREIIDPNHHLCTTDDLGGAFGQYLLVDLHGDTGSGHPITETIFVECGAQYRADGPPHLRPLGETEFVAAIAQASDGATIAGIVAHADLALPLEQLDEMLDGHGAASGGRFRGIRDTWPALQPVCPKSSPMASSHRPTRLPTRPSVAAWLAWEN